MLLSRRNWLQALFTLSISTALGCQRPVVTENSPTIPIPTTPLPPVEQLQAFATEINQFGFDLFQQMRQSPGNLFLSPYSINTALAMCATGARGNTADQMTQVLHLTGGVAKYTSMHQGLMTSLLYQPAGYDIRMANALWCQNAHPFDPGYIQNVQQRFGAEARTMDFQNNAEASRGIINKWVETQTNDRIKDLLPAGSLNTNTKLVSTNAIYFKGKWSTPFRKDRTRNEAFHLTASQTINTDMMHRRDRIRYADNTSIQLVELPYEGNRLSMVVLLPKTRHELATAEASLTAEKLTALIASLRTEDVVLTLPRFKTTYSLSLPTVLKGMGITDAFNPSTADFSGVDGSRELFISEVVHKAFCEVNEEGTEAAAATRATGDKSARSVETPPAPKVFQADQPFLYLIRDTQTGSILFLGRITDPTKT